MGSSKQYGQVECEANINKGLDNLLWFAKQATDIELSGGLQWYAEAYNACVNLSQLYDLPLDHVIKCVACLSPQLRWSVNVIAAEVVIRHYVSGGYIPSYNDYLTKVANLKQLGSDPRLPQIKANVTGANKVKALWILQGYNALGGQKVNSFADNIFRFSDSQSVTVDSHAINAWFGVTSAQSVSVTPSFYPIIAADYRRCAKIMGVSPLECQAIIWIVKRRLSGSDQSDYMGVDVIRGQVA